MACARRAEEYQATLVQCLMCLAGDGALEP